MDKYKLLSELDKTPYGKVLRSFLEEELKELNDISKAESWEDTLGRQKAVRIVNKLFSFMNKEVNKVDKSKNQYK